MAEADEYVPIVDVATVKRASTKERIMSEGMSLYEVRSLQSSLLTRAGMSTEFTSKIDSEAMSDPHEIALAVLAEKMDVGPDENWFKDYWRLTGDHMVLTEEGWIPAEFNALEYTGEQPMEVLDEVNKPEPTE